MFQVKNYANFVIKITQLEMLTKIPLIQKNAIQVILDYWILSNFLWNSQHNSSAQNSPSQVSPSPPKHLNTSQYGSEHDNSSVNSSRTASPDPNNRRDSNSSGTVSTPQMNFLQKQKEIKEREGQVRVEKVKNSTLKLFEKSKLSENWKNSNLFLRTAKMFHHIHQPVNTTTNRQFHPEACHPRYRKDNQASRKFRKFRSARRAQMEMVSRSRMSTVLLLILPLYPQKITTATHLRTVRIPSNSHSHVHHSRLQTAATETETELKKFGCDKAMDAHQVSFGQFFSCFFFVFFGFCFVIVNGF